MLDTASSSYDIRPRRWENLLSPIFRSAGFASAVRHAGTGFCIGSLALLVAVLPVAIGELVAGRAGGEGVDFAVFWVAGRLALTGDARGIYDWPWFLEFAATQLHLDLSPGLVWRNPPHFLFVAIPISVLAIEWSWAIWNFATLGSLLWIVWKVVPSGRQALVVALSPASILCALLGQNGFLTAVLATLAMLWLDRRPTGSGLCIALLTYKPHFGVVLPVLLLFSRRYRTFLAACVGSVALVGLSAAAFGPDSWVAFAQSLTRGAADLSGDRSGGADFYFYHSVHAAVVLFGGGSALAWTLHLTVAIAATAIAARFWVRSAGADGDLRAVATFAAMMLATPYVFAYDQVLVAVAASFIARTAARTGGWLKGELLLTAVAWLLPVLAFLGPALFAGPLAWMILLGLVLRRDAATRHSER